MLPYTDEKVKRVNKKKQENQSIKCILGMENCLAEFSLKGS